MAGVGNILVQVKHQGCCGEIVLLTTSPFLTVLNTNCFVRQFSSGWVHQEANNGTEDD